MSDDYDLSKITYEPRYRDGFAATGSDRDIKPQGMVWWVGKMYGPHETREDAEQVSAKLIAQEEETERHKKEITNLAESAKMKLTESEWQAVYELGVHDGRGYW